MAGKGILEEIRELLERLGAMSEKQLQDLAYLSAAVLQAQRPSRRKRRRKIRCGGDRCRRRRPFITAR